MRGLVADRAGAAGKRREGDQASRRQQQAARAGIAVIIAPGRAEGALGAALDPAARMRHARTAYTDQAQEPQPLDRVRTAPPPER